MTTPTRITEAKRVEAVRASGLMDSEPEADFDRLARLAAQLLNAPGAFVTVISGDRQYLKSAVDADGRAEAAGTSTAIDRSFCQFTVAANEPFLVEDAREHELVKDNKAVEDGVIAYAGVPLQTQDGEPIGALCVVDSKPRQWSPDDVENLRALGRGVMQLIGERESAGRQQRSSAEPDTRSLIDCAAHHIRAADQYKQLVESPGPLDLSAEAAAREQLVTSVADLRGAFEKHGSGAAAEQPDVAAAVEEYLKADLARDTTARAFALGSAELSQLERAIQRHMDAADHLRIVAIDHGAEL